MSLGANNPRIFAETMALDAWRSKYDGQRGEANLHVDIIFDPEGRVGGIGAPIRFRLSLKKAEVRVITGTEGIIRILKSSVVRQKLDSVKSNVTSESKTVGKVGGSLGASSSGLSASVGLDASKSFEFTERMEKNQELAPMVFTHWPTAEGYAFKISPRNGDRLIGQPWAAADPILKLHDTNSFRIRGEPPEIKVEIHCMREDMIIEDVEFTTEKFQLWSSLTRNKQIAIEQYLREELQRSGLPCGNITEKFCRIVLGDVVPSVE